MNNTVASLNIADSKFDQSFYGHGKILLSGEYFILDGARGLALPTKLGQSLKVRYEQSYKPVFNWKSFDSNGELWLEANFEFWQFDCIDDNPADEVLLLQRILRQARLQNKHFLRDDVSVFAETKLDFPLSWGLGSSSTLIYNIAQWAYISPFELLFNTHGGSGYDIACAQSDGPIVYEKSAAGPFWAPIKFNPSFKDQLFLVYLGHKQDSRKAIEFYNNKRPLAPELIINLSTLTEDLVKAKSIEEFDFTLSAHEVIVAENLDMVPVKKRLFSDFWGEVKSLGAWGGDFVMVTSKKSYKETKKYFTDKGYDTFLRYSEIILCDSDACDLENQAADEVIH